MISSECFYKGFSFDSEYHLGNNCLLSQPIPGSPLDQYQLRAETWFFPVILTKRCKRNLGGHIRPSHFNIRNILAAIFSILKSKMWMTLTIVEPKKSWQLTCFWTTGFLGNFHFHFLKLVHIHVPRFTTWNVHLGTKLGLLDSPHLPLALAISGSNQWRIVRKGCFHFGIHVISKWLLHTCYASTSH